MTATNTTIPCIIHDGTDNGERSRASLGDVLAPHGGDLAFDPRLALRVWSHASGVLIHDLTGPRATWADQVQAAIVATKADDFNAGAHLHVECRALDDGGLLATWDGCMTLGREVSVWVRPTGPAVLRWRSGTGRPSWWLGRAFLSAGVARVSRRDLRRLLPRLDPETAGRLAALALDG